jgi:hypothetical protein
LLIVPRVGVFTVVRGDEEKVNFEDVLSVGRHNEYTVRGAELHSIIQETLVFYLNLGQPDHCVLDVYIAWVVVVREGREVPLVV